MCRRPHITSLHSLLQQVIASSYGQEYSFWLAAAITGVHTIVLLILLPETRGKSLAEIQRLLASSPGDKSGESLIPELQKIQIVPAPAIQTQVKVDDVSRVYEWSGKGNGGDR